jgi:ArsR family transcriptional regulator, arsenate/arsenite/antimonite-responsive transcriptional repressor
MENKDALVSLSALAQEHRLNLFRLLVQAGDGGLSMGELSHRSSRGPR